MDFNWAIGLLCGITLVHAGLSAEIELVDVQWIAPKCIGTCITRVTDLFRQLNGTAELIVSQPEGRVSLRWKPYAPFRTDAITNTMSAIGLRSQDIRLRVRGTISRRGRSFILRSMGDNTKFILLGPPPVSMSLFIPTRSIETHVISPELQQHLAHAERYFVVVTVEGPLFTALRQPGIYLIAERVQLHRLGPGAILGRPIAPLRARTGTR